MHRPGRHALAAVALTAVVSGAAVSAVVPSAQAEGQGDTRITKTVANGGAPVVVGPRTPVAFPIRLWVSDSSGVKRFDGFSTFAVANGRGYAHVVSSTCTKTSTKMSLCRRTVRIDPTGLAGYDDGSANTMAGRWTVNADVAANDGDYWIADDLTRYEVLRQTKLAIGPRESTAVAKGHALRFVGRLQHADWEHQRWAALGGRRVELRFKKSGASSYKTVKTVTASRRGYLSTKVTVTGPGTYRWRFLGTGRDALGLSTQTPVTTS